MNFGKFIRDISSRLKNGGRDHFEINFDSESASILKNKHMIASIPWDSVKKVVAGKIDKFTYDPIVICLFDSIDVQHGIVFEELMVGFNEFLLEINRRYELDESWFDRLNRDVFVANWETIWICN